MPDCVFCQIVQGEIPATKVYEDDQTLAFLDVHPLTRGHTLVIPKRHHRRLMELSESESQALMRTTRQVLPALGRALGHTDHTVALHDGPAAGQEVPHLHLHLIPRKEGDGGGPIHATFSEPADPSPETLTTLADEVRSYLGQTAPRSR